MSLQLHFPGDLTKELPGRVMGPDLHGATYVVTAVVYSAETHKTTAYLRPFLPDELYRLDEFGQAYAYAAPHDEP